MPDTDLPPARALWIEAATRAALRPAEVRPAPDEVVIETVCSGISRGTERLVFEGRVPASEHARMRCPLQEGTFAFPVKYGYAAVGRITSGPPERIGQMVFALGPHQTRFACPDGMARRLPDGLDPGLAVLGANMETALTVAWDAGIGPGDRVAVVGAGVVGALVARLAARQPGTEVTLIDRNPARARLAAALGCSFAAPGALAAGGCDVVIHASASAAGLSEALGLAGPEATVVEASWHGATQVAVPLGGAFHSQRLRLISSQVGRVPPARAPRWSNARRLDTALSLLAEDPACAELISGETSLDDLPAAYGAILADPETLCHRVRH
ncbi:MAG: zinc-dependent alcohol dehydrogenase [Alkalilacustris sp.]